MTRHGRWVVLIGLCLVAVMLAARGSGGEMLVVLGVLVWLWPCDGAGLEQAPGDADEAEFSEDDIRELAQVRTMLRAGHAVEARARLDRVLDGLDPAWRTLA
jgi:hypothetical protein